VFSFLNIADKRSLCWEVSLRTFISGNVRATSARSNNEPMKYKVSVCTSPIFSSFLSKSYPEGKAFLIFTVGIL